MKEINTHTPPPPPPSIKNPTMTQYHPQLKETHKSPLPSRKNPQQPTTK